MKGDITFKINKKIGLGLIGALSLFATADFVSMVDLKSSGGIVIEKETQTIGSVVFRMDNTNPADIYGGTWKLLAKDSTLNFGDGSSQNGLVSGSNFPLVPVSSHSHEMNHDHPAASTNTAGNHYHEGGVGVHSSYNNTYPQSSPFGSTYRAGSFNGFQFGAWIHNADFPRTSTTGNHAHSVDLPNFNGNTSSTGEANATLDVRGQIITINVWQRIG